MYTGGCISETELNYCDVLCCVFSFCIIDLRHMIIPQLAAEFTVLLNSHLHHLVILWDLGAGIL